VQKTKIFPLLFSLRIRTTLWSDFFQAGNLYFVLCTFSKDRSVAISERKMHGTVRKCNNDIFSLIQTTKIAGVPTF